MSQYLTLIEFKLLSTIPGGFVDAVELVSAGYTDAQLAYWSDWIDARLRKRYMAPFATPYPNAVKGWLARIVTPKVWTKRGVDPQDQQWVEVKKDDEDARAEIKEAADSADGLFDLPLRQDTTATGISQGVPHAYSEQSPYVWTDAQGAAGRDEDSSRGGSTV